MNKKYDYIKIEKKWQKQWFEEKIQEATRNNENKFFIHFAYPGVSGYLHVGHMRGFTYCDIIARYKKMKGFDVFFPAGFHASGNPSIGFAKKVERKDKTMFAYSNKMIGDILYEKKIVMGALEAYQTAIKILSKFPREIFLANEVKEKISKIQDMPQLVLVK